MRPPSKTTTSARATARGYGRLVDYVETVSGADRPTVSRFFATGMLMNVLAAMQYSIDDDPRDSWVARLAEGCRRRIVRRLFFSPVGE